MQLDIVYGPTGSGKTSLAVELARTLNGELINADSRQIYRYMDIGTNKDIDKKAGSAKETFIDGIRIHLIDIINPDERYDVSCYQQDVKKAIADIRTRGKVPILVGGSGLYIDAIAKGYELPPAKPNSKLREELDSFSLIQLQHRLQKSSSDRFSKLNNSDKHNPRRLVRAIEIAESPELFDQKAPEQLTISWHQPQYDKEELMKKINERVIDMLSNGLIDEVKGLLAMGYSENDPGLQTMGYREVIEYLKHEITIPELIKKVQLAHRQYAKKQITWFKKYVKK